MRRVEGTTSSSAAVTLETVIAEPFEMWPEMLSVASAGATSEEPFKMELGDSQPGAGPNDWKGKLTSLQELRHALRLKSLTSRDSHDLRL